MINKKNCSLIVLLVLVGWILIYSNFQFKFYEREFNIMIWKLKCLQVALPRRSESIFARKFVGRIKVISIVLLKTFQYIFVFQQFVHLLKFGIYLGLTKRSTDDGACEHSTTNFCSKIVSKIEFCRILHRPIDWENSILLSLTFQIPDKQRKRILTAISSRRITADTKSLQKCHSKL